MNAYKYGLSGPESTYFSPLEANDHFSRVDASTRTWDYFPVMDQNVPAGMDEQSREDALQGVPALPEECQSLSVHLWFKLLIKDAAYIIYTEEIGTGLFYLLLFMMSAYLIFSIALTGITHQENDTSSQVTNHA